MSGATLIPSADSGSVEVGAGRGRDSCFAVDFCGSRNQRSGLNSSRSLSVLEVGCTGCSGSVGGPCGQ